MVKKKSVPKFNFLFGNGESENLSIIKNFNHIPSLSAKQEKVLFAMYKNNKSKKYKEIIFNAYLKMLNQENRLVKYSKIFNRPIKDVFSAAIVGLLKAIDKFDYKREVRFYGYVNFWIMREIQEFTYKEVKMIESCHSSERLNYLKQINEIKKSKLSAEEKEKKIKALDKTVYIRYENIDDVNVMNHLPHKYIDDNDIVADSQKEMIYNLVKHPESQNILTERECKVLEFRYYEDMSLEEVGKKIGLTRERIRQIEEICLKKIRKNFQINRTAYESMNDILG